MGKKLCYPGRCHTDADVLQMEQHLRKTGNIIHMALVNVDHTWTVWTPANNYVIIAAVK
jgi:hypothetical protein